MEKKLNMVIADDDYRAVRPLEEDLIRRFYGEANLHIITTEDYLQQYFETDRVIDLLVISRSFYGDYLKKHQIRQIFLTVPEVEVGEVYPDNVTVIMKFMPKEEILAKLEAAMETCSAAEAEAEEAEEHELKVVGVYSPIGGCGKSLASIALARKLKKLDQKVLVVSCDPMQSASVFFSQTRSAGEDLAEALKNPGEDTYWSILQNIVQEEVSFLLPFDKALPYLGLGMREWRNLVSILRQKKDFDYLMLDLGTAFGPEMSELLEEAGCMIFLTEPGEMANMKVQKLLKHAELLPRCECIMIANEYHADAQRITSSGLFGVIAPYTGWREALEDPVFYRIALKLTE